MSKSLTLSILGNNLDAKAKLDVIKVSAEELAAMHPELIMGINTAEAQAELAVFRDKMKADIAEAQSVPLEIKVSSAEARAKIDAIKASAEELRLLNPTITPRINDMEASAQLAVLRGEIGTTEAEAGGLGSAFGGTSMALLGVAAGLGYGIVKAAGFSSAMEQIHTQAGVAQASIGPLSAQVLQLAGQVGEAPDSLAEAAYHVESNMASMGATTTQVMSAVKVAAEGARVGNADLVDVTNALGAAIASGIPGVQNYQSAMGVLNATVGAGDMKMQDLAEALGTGFLSNVKIYGSTLNDVGSILATFGDNNIRGAMAGTQLRMSVQSIAVQAKSAGPALKELGLHIGELGKFQSIHGTVATIGLLVDKMKEAGVSSKDEGEIITELFGKKAGAGVAVLVDQYDRLKSKTAELAKGSNDFGAAVAANNATSQQQFERLKSGTEALAITMGEKLLPAATKVEGWLADFVDGLIKGSAAAQGIAAVIGAVLAGIALKKLEGGLMSAVEGFQGLWKAGAKAVAFVGEMTGKMLGLTIAQDAQTASTEASTVAQGELDVAMDANPIGLIVIAIIALVAAFVYLWTHSAAFRNFWEGLWRDIVGFVKTAWSVITGVISGAWSAISGFFSKAGSEIAKPFVSAYDAVIGVFDRLKNFITTSFDNWWAQNGAELKQIWSAIWDAISAIFRAWWNVNVTIAKAGWSVITDVFKTAATLISGSWRVLWDGLAPVFSAAWTVITTIAKAAFIVVSAIFSAGIAAVTTVWTVAWNFIVAIAKTVWAAIWAVTKIGWDLIVGIFDVTLAVLTGHWGKAWSSIETTAKQIWNAIQSFFSSALSNFSSAITKSFDSVVSFFSSIPGRVLSALGNLGSLLFNAGKSIISGLLSGLESEFSAVTSFVSNVAGIISSLKGPLSYDATLLTPHGRAIMGGLVGGLQDGMPGLKTQLARTTSVIASTSIPAVAASGGRAGLTAEWIGGGGADQEFLTWLKRNIRIRGGDPGVLGR